MAALVPLDSRQARIARYLLEETRPTSVQADRRQVIVHERVDRERRVRA